MEDWLDNLANGLETEEPTRIGKRTKSERKIDARDAFKARRRVKRREKQAEKRKQISEERHNYLDSLSTEERLAYVNEERDRKARQEEELKERLARDLDFGRLKLCINCDYMDTMVEKEQVSLAKQIQWIWNSVVRHPHYSCQITLANFSNEVQTFCNRFGLKNWKMHFTSEDPYNRFDTDRLIVLSPDADESLTVEDLRDDSNVFVIGGIVDRSVRKFETKNYAKQLELKCRKLPLDQCPIRVFPVLNVNAVYDILAAVKFDHVSWAEAVAKFTPSRRHQNKREDLSETSSTVAD